jgi:tetratricopeptide (TPR) repeat protein
MQPERGGVSDRSYRAGIGLLNKGMYEPAVKELKAFLEASPGAKEASAARYGLAVCFSRLGQHAEAVRELERVLKDDAFELRDDAGLLCGHSLIAIGQDERAIEVLTRVSERKPANAVTGRASLLAGETLYRKGEFEKAIGAFNAAKGACEGAERVRATLFLGLSTLATGDAGRAATVLASITPEEAGEMGPFAALGEARARHELGELEKAERLYERAGREGSDAVKVEAKLGLGRLYREQGKLDEAAGVLRSVEADGASGGFGGIVGLERAKVAIEQGDIAGAVRELDQLGAIVGEDLADDVAYWRGKCELRAGENEKAAVLLMRAAERYPSSELRPEMEFDAATALTRAERLDEAKSAWKKWLSMHSEHGLRRDAATALAGCSLREGDFDACIAACEAELSRGGRGVDANGAELEMLAAEGYRGLGKHAEAVARYASAEKSGGDGAVAWRASVRRGESLIELGRGAEGAALLARSLREGEGQDVAVRASGLGALGGFMLSQERWSEAADCFKQLAEAMKGTSGEGDAMLREGLARSKGGDAEGAATVLTRAMQLNPESASANHARFELGQMLVEAGDDARAMKLLEEVVERESMMEKERPLTAHAVRQLAGIASRGGDPGRAAELLGEIEGGGSVSDRFSRASAMMAAGAYEGAAQEYDVLLREHGDDERAGEAMAMRGIAINRLGRHVEAIAELRRVKIGGLSDAVADAVRYEIALALKMDGKRDEAIAMYEELAARGTGARFKVFGAIDAAQLYCEAGKFDRAMTMLERCDAALAEVSEAERVQIEPRAVYLRGLSLLRLGDAAGAVRVLESDAALRADATLKGHMSIVKGEGLLAVGRGREAAETLGEVLKSGTQGANLEVVALRIGEAWAAAQEWEKSEAAYGRFLSEWPASELWFQAKFGQGWAREQRGMHDAAIETYREVVEKHDGQTAARAQFQIGECLYGQRKFDAAVAEFLKVDVLYVYPEWSSAAIYEAGRCLAESGKNAEALKQFDDVIARFGETSWAKLAKEAREMTRPEAVPGRDAKASRN